jgi:hypothetical protein
MNKFKLNNSFSKLFYYNIKRKTIHLNTYLKFITYSFSLV